MKKTTKGALAAGAAAVLLAGGAGTYAAWSSDGGAVSGGIVNSGHLRITQVTGTGAWHWDTAEGTELGEDDTIVPGDTVVYVAKYTLDIEGTNLKAAASLTGTSGVTDTGAADTTAGLATELDPGTPVPTGEAGVDLGALDEDDDGTTVTVATPVTFTHDGSAIQGGMDGQVSLTNVGVVLKQTAPATAP